MGMQSWITLEEFKILAFLIIGKLLVFMLMYLNLQGWDFYRFMAVGNILDGVCNSTNTQRAKEFRSDNFIGNLCAFVGFFYLS